MREEVSLGDMLQHVDLQDGELDDVVVGELEAKIFAQATSWLAIRKVVTKKSFSPTALFETLKFVWGLEHVPKCREVVDNVFIFQMFYLGDLEESGTQGTLAFQGARCDARGL